MTMLASGLTNATMIATTHTAGANRIRLRAPRMISGGVVGGINRKPVVAYHQCRWSAPPIRISVMPYV